MGCGDPARVKGFCTGHYQQLRKRGLDGLAPLRKQGRPLAERFEEKVNRSGDCHLWTGAVSGKNSPYSGGYGCLQGEAKGQTVLAHRVAWELAHGPIPDGLQVDHICRNRLCVNTAHLRLVTCKQNAENQDGQRTNPTGLRGVTLTAQGRFRARVKHNRKDVDAGTWPTPEQAAKAAAVLRSELFTHAPEADGRVKV